MKRLRVALVETASTSAHVYSRTYLPRVGLPTLAAILRDRGHECDLWFQSLSKLNEPSLRQYDLVGIGSLTNTIHEAYRLADSLRPGGPAVVMGGPHVTFMPEEALAHCDYVVIGEGDLTFPALVDALANGESPKDIPGLAYPLPGGGTHSTGPAEPVDYANLPSPDFTLSPQVKPGRIPPIIVTSRGCPHHCSFCTVTAVFGRRYRFKSNRQVISEVRSVQDRSLCFGDDNFCAQPTRTKSLLKDMLKENAAPLRWSGQMCVAAASDLELLDLMRETRCRIVYVGIESINPETLKKFGKAHQVDAIALCIENLHRYDIGIHGMFVVGLDDSLETPRKIVDYALAADIDTIQIFALIPFPGTASYGQFKDRLLHHDWKYFDGMHVVLRPENCSAYDLQMAIAGEMDRFYSLKRAALSYRRGRGWRVKYRLGGHYLLRKWVKENEDYFERLRALG